MLKGERTRLQRYAIESTPARVYEGCCTWFTILVLSAQCNQEERRRTKVRRLSFVRRGFGKLAFQSPWTQTLSGLWPGRSFLIAHGQTELPEGPRPDGISGLSLFWQKPLLNTLRGGFSCFWGPKKCTKNAPEKCFCQLSANFND